MLPVKAMAIDGLPPPPVDNWRPPVASDEAVQVTHVDAALAKISCAHLGYFKDTWTETLIRNTRPYPRSPLIHRGYYSRVVAIRNTVTSFLSKCPPGSGVQIVNLGAGFDTLYFWLRESSYWRDDLVFFEVDFPEVLSKKRSALAKRQALWPQFDIASQEAFQDATSGGTAGSHDLRTPHYRFVSADMRISPELETCMADAGLKGDVATLFISECVLVYMQAMHGDNIIKWAGSVIQDAPSAMIVYEQTNPNDKFGKVMVENLMNRGCPLLSIHEYPSMPAQIARYQDRGWEQCCVEDMIKIYGTRLDQSEVQRIQKLELLDEFEEWNLIQAHYFLLVASSSKGAEGNWVHEISGAVNQDAAQSQTAA
mmetsp:Transcript_44004/g.104132  ORF Transcript_44004/g.104132 Transcript_44004/m.104132 type:complete len:368 (+) Transcript_44004:84-1187(+)